MAFTYRLPDEPVGPITSRLVVAPVFPLLAFMLAGAWLGAPWLIFNGFALKSPTRVREMSIALALLAGSFLLILLMMRLLNAGLISSGAIPYGFVILTGFRLALAYWIHLLQERTFEIYRYFGGIVRNGLIVLVVGMILRTRILSGAPSVVAGVFF